MRIIVFDTEGSTSRCPISDTGTATKADCMDCDWLRKFVGMDKAECDWDNPEQMPE